MKNINTHISFLAYLILNISLLGAAPLSSDIFVGVGADLPFITHEAESATNTLIGEAHISQLPLPPIRTSSPAQEASGRAFVELAKAGDGLEIPVTESANSIVIRYNIPDSEEGGGIDASLTLLINGQPRQVLSLSSRHTWLYGPPGENGQSNTPNPNASGSAHVFWEEARTFIEGPELRRGDILQLRKTLSDTAEYYRIDLIDLELVGAPLQKPADGTYLNVKDYGAKGDGITDDTASIIATIAAAKEQMKNVWLPPGIYVQTDRFEVDGPIIIQGAGMWYTKILGTKFNKTWRGTMGFDLKGKGPALRDFYIESRALTSRRQNGGKAITGNASYWRVERIWITHTNVGLWMSGATHGVVRDTRVRFTYADGINLNRGASHNLLENNHIRGSGDDGIAFLSETKRGDPPSTDNIARYNTVTCTWWGQNIDLAGGENHIIESNYLADNALTSVFAVNMTGAYPNHPLSHSVFRNNILVRGGGDYAGQKRGALWLYSGDNTISSLEITDNHIIDPFYRAIHFAGSKTQDIVFIRNQIKLTKTQFADNIFDIIYIAPELTGTSTFRNNSLSGFTHKQPIINNRALKNFIIKEFNNHW